MASFTLRASIAAPIEVVFDVLTGHRGYAEITALRSSTLQREGDPAPNGVGAIRALHVVGRPIREQVTAFEPPHRFAYKMLSGAPVQTHTATVELAVEGSGTELSWQVDSVAKAPIPDAVWSPVMKQIINHLLKGIVKEAERRSAAG